MLLFRAGSIEVGRIAGIRESKLMPSTAVCLDSANELKPDTVYRENVDRTMWISFQFLP